MTGMSAGAWRASRPSAVTSGSEPSHTPPPKSEPTLTGAAFIQLLSCWEDVRSCSGAVRSGPEVRSCEDVLVL